MGNYRFKMSEMLPNAWFYKLNHTSTRKLQNLTHKSSNKNVQSKANSSPFSSSCHLKKSYYFESTSHLSVSPRKSSGRRRDTEKFKASPKLIAISSASNVYSVHHMFELVENDPAFSDLDSEFERAKVDSPSNYYDKKIETNNSISNHNHQKVENWSNCDLASQLGLKPIITRLDKADHAIKTAVMYQGRSMELEEESPCNIPEKKRCPVRKLRVKSAGVKLRANSSRLASKRLTQVEGRESVSSHSRLMSVAIVKETTDPDRDFKESMMEMIMENNISTTEEFEQLLACYLSLNSEALHELIVKVFEQIWFEITGD